MAVLEPRIITGVDIETTGFLKPEHRIIEAHFEIMDFKTRKVLKSITYRINPERSIDKGAQAVHHITLEDLKDAPLWGAVAPKIKSIMEMSDLMVGHNGDDFDLPFIIQELERVGIEFTDKMDVETFDTMKEGRWSTPFGKWPKLGELCKACGVEYDAGAAHAADYDVKVMMESFWWGLDNGWFKLPEIREAA